MFYRFARVPPAAWPASCLLVCLPACCLRVCLLPACLPACVSACVPACLLASSARRPAVRLLSALSLRQAIQHPLFHTPKKTDGVVAHGTADAPRCASVRDRSRGRQWSARPRGCTRRVSRSFSRGPSAAVSAMWSARKPAPPPVMQPPVAWDVRCAQCGQPASQQFHCSGCGLERAYCHQYACQADGWSLHLPLCTGLMGTIYKEDTTITRLADGSTYSRRRRRSIVRAVPHTLSARARAVEGTY